MTIASREAARAWRRNELDKLRHAVARASAELRRLDGEVEKLAGALGETGAAPAMAVLDSLRERRAEAAAEIDRLMKAASDAFTDLCSEEAAAAPAAEIPPAAAAAR
ncbi:MAG: hypothetical protein INF91_06165 [Alphaproteobacteria bacterium]|nr:hypothetical protein [Alphaproteobacteria bacterium]